MKYLALDGEMTGLVPGKHNLLTMAFLVYDSATQELLDELELVFKPNADPNDDTYTWSPGALAVNKIDMVDHWSKAESWESCVNKMKAFFKRHADVTKASIVNIDSVEFPLVLKPVIEPLVPLGHNVAGDLKFLQVVYPELTKYVSYRVMDTVIVSRLLMDLNIFRTDTGKSGLENLAKHFGYEYAAHTARGDAWCTAQVYFGMVNLLCSLLPGYQGNMTCEEFLKSRKCTKHSIIRDSVEKDGLVPDPLDDLYPAPASVGE